MSLDIDQLLFHAVGAEKLTERQAMIAGKLYRGQKIDNTHPDQMCLDDGTTITLDDLKLFDREALTPILTRGASALSLLARFEPGRGS